MDFDRARFNMVEQQIRTWEVLDTGVLDVLGRLHREDFVRPQYRKLAYADMMLPIGEDQFMMRPVIEGRLLQSLDLTNEDEVLEIGTGSGFVTACLAQLARHVISVERSAELADAARARLDRADVENAEVIVADALGDWTPGRYFDVVAVTGSARVLPERFRSWVKPGGRLFAVGGDSPAMEAVIYRHLDDGGWSEESLFETDLPRLVGAEDTESLAF
ncbi:MAG: protein-L-isoaspartate O-methyltransferase [Pseudomonadota bacterium]